MPFNSKEYTEINDFIKKNKENKAKIIAVSKNQSSESVLEAINFGVKIFGENRVQEALKKFVPLKKLYKDLKLHLLGPLQSNKVLDALSLFDVIHTLDREKLAKEIYKHKEILNNKSLFVQINMGKEESKSGIYPENAEEFINYCINDLKLPVIGLMCIPPIKDDPRVHFNFLQKISQKNNLKELSMGMSGDYKQGINSGATFIRVGTKIFGKRDVI